MCSLILAFYVTYSDNSVLQINMDFRDIKEAHEAQEFLSKLHNEDVSKIDHFVQFGHDSLPCLETKLTWVK